jgi:class 3 adenylate cyclase
VDVPQVRAEWPATVRGGRPLCAARRGHVATVPRNSGGSATGLAREQGSVRLDGDSCCGQCGLFAVDIVGFTQPQRDEDIQLYMHKSLYEMLEIAFGRCDIPWINCSREDRGDGVLIVTPPTLPAERLISIPDRLRLLIRRHNRVSCEAAHIQLRAAINLGPVHHDGLGFIGADVNLLYRLLDARQFKRRLSGLDSEIALIASDYFYEHIIRPRPSIMESAMFDAVMIRDKNINAQAWIYLPGA